MAITPIEPSSITALRERVRRLQSRSSEAGAELATHPALAGLVRLRAGGVYAVAPTPGGAGLALALLAGPSAAGAWSAVVGVPDFGVEAAAEMGARLERTVLVPQPGELWLEATAALVDVVTLVVVRPTGRVTEAVAAKLAARLRSRAAALIALESPALGPWPCADVRLTTEQPRWDGVGRGEGHLRSRRVVVAAQRGNAPVRRAELWFHGADLAVGAAASAHSMGDKPLLDGPQVPNERVAG